MKVRFITARGETVEAEAEPGDTLLRAARGQFTAVEHTGVTVTSLYWHTVDGIWLAILASLYLSPRLA